jgi:hypothetical protein
MTAGEMKRVKLVDTSAARNLNETDSNLKVGDI